MNPISNELEILQVEEKLKSILYFENASPDSLEWGMNYITFSPSKRVRPLLLLESARIFSTSANPGNDAYLLGAIVELIHTYSLVHDDLPSMDNDDLRRGLKTLHVLKNEAYAVLVGDALLTRAFALFSSYSKVEKLPELITLFCTKAGYPGMLKGQLLDLEGENKSLTTKQMETINYYKTANLLQLSLVAGGIDAGADADSLKLLEKLGDLTGQIFQLTDDILDIVGSTSVIGKQVGSDQNNKKSSIPLSEGLDAARTLLSYLKNEARNLIENLPQNRDFFYTFLDFLVTREK